eukprot:Amastigsp_a174720_307.p1 type:complete len:188 gc:universal Amastigsp_a174720_307:84-647(+)
MPLKHRLPPCRRRARRGPKASMRSKRLCRRRRARLWFSKRRSASFLKPRRQAPKRLQRLRRRALRGFVRFCSRRRTRTSSSPVRTRCRARLRRRFPARRESSLRRRPSARPPRASLPRKQIRSVGSTLASTMSAARTKLRTSKSAPFAGASDGATLRSWTIPHQFPEVELVGPSTTLPSSTDAVAAA